MGNLANLYKDQGKYDAAEPLYKKCVEFSYLSSGTIIVLLRIIKQVIKSEDE
jgi:hypothetical protein